MQMCQMRTLLLFSYLYVSIISNNEMYWTTLAKLLQEESTGQKG